MSFQSVWYVRHGDQVLGPFPERMIQRGVLLGRFSRADQVSPDRAVWLRLSEVAELLPQAHAETEDGKPKSARWKEERHLAELRWADERSQPDRRREEPGATAVEKDARGRRDRRVAREAPDVIAKRKAHAEHPLPSRQGKWQGALLVLIWLGVIVLGMAIFLPPVQPIKVGLGPVTPSCQEPPAADINWSGCNRSGAWLPGVILQGGNLTNTLLSDAQLGGSNLSYANLSGADLSNAKLKQAMLLGANLANAKLVNADLSNANLSYADMRHAQIDGMLIAGARLDHAVWSDGTICAAGSVGQCIRASARGG